MYVIPSYTYASNSIKLYYDENTNEYKVTMLTINPNHLLDSEYSKNNEEIPDEYINDFSFYMLSDVENYEYNDGFKGEVVDRYRRYLQNKYKELEKKGNVEQCA